MRDASHIPEHELEIEVNGEWKKKGIFSFDIVSKKKKRKVIMNF
jgi:hypothetical protein